jgi:hypothetical protein
MTQKWVFDQPPNAAAITSKHVISREKPILLVSHDLDDHGWQFLTGESVSTDEAKVVSMQEIVEIDPTLKEVSDLPPGWSAQRSTAGSSWMRYKSRQA